MHTFTIGENRVNPTFNIAATAVDVTCDDITFTPTGQATATVTNGSAAVDDYLFTWYFDAAGTNTLDPADAANLADITFAGTGASGNTANGQAGVNRVNNLPAGTYYLKIQDNTTPGLGCPSTIKSVTIQQFLPTLSVGPAITTDFNLTDVSDCNPVNGAYEVLQIKESQSDGSTATNATTNYSFTWYEADGTTTIGTAANPNATATFLNTANGAVANGATDAREVTGLVPGTYFVHIKNINTGCPDVTPQVHTFTIGEDKNPVLATLATANNVNCDATLTPTGSVTATLQNQSPLTNANFTFTWYTGTVTAANVGTATRANVDAALTAETFPAAAGPSEGNIMSQVPEGTYTVRIVNNVTGSGAGCEAYFTTTVNKVTVTPTFNIPATQLTHSTLCTGGNGSFRIQDSNISGVIGDYTWKLYNSAKSQIGADLNVAGGSPYNHQTVTSSGLAPGEYYLTAKSNATGCESSFIKFTIEDHHVNPSLTAVVTKDQGCTGGTLGVGAITITVAAQDVDGVGGTDGTTITWANSSGALPAFNGLTTITGLSADTYTVTVLNNVSQCSVSQKIVVGSQPLPVVVTARTTTDQTNCTANGAASVDTITLGGAATVMSDFRFTWTDVTNSTTLVNNVIGQNSISNLAAGSYTVTLTHIVTGCAQTLQYQVEEEITYPLADIVLVRADQSCNTSGANGELSVTVDNPSAPGYLLSNYVITWYAGSGTTGTNLGNTKSISGLAAGPYTVQVLNSLTGCTSIAEIELESDPTVPKLLLTDITTSPMTNCTPANGSIEINGVSPGVLADYTFELWDQNPANAGASPIATVTDTIFNNVAAGIYFIRAVDNTFGCTSIEVQVEVEDTSTPPVVSQVDIQIQTNCNPAIPNGSFTVTANGSSDLTAYTFTWYRGTTATGTPLLTNNNTLSGIAAGDYTVVVTNVATGCSTTVTYPMVDESINPLQISTTATVNDRCIAPFDGVVAANLLTLPFGKSTQDYKFVWNAGLVPPTFDTFDFEGQSWENLNSGTYTLMVFNISDPFCKSEPISILVPDATEIPDVVITETQALTICFEDQANGELTASLADGTVTGHTFEWFEGSVVDPANKLFDGPVVGNLSTGPYTLLVTNAITGCTSIQTFDVSDQRVPPSNPIVTLVSNMTSCEAPNGEARATVDGNIGNYQFDWYEASDLTTIIYTGFDPKGLGRQEETVEYVVIATDLITGCISEESRISISDARTTPQFVVDVQDSQCLVPTGVALLVFPEPVELDSVVWTHLGTGVNTFEGGLFDAPLGDYSVTIWDGNGCTATQEFTIGADIIVYQGVSANGDGLNDVFIIDCIDQFPNNTVKVFNRAGALVYEDVRYNNDDVSFNGTSNRGITVGNGQLPAGTYFYLIDKGDGSDPLSGYLELVR